MGIGELAAAVGFAAVAAASIAPRLATANDRAALWSALVPLLAILVQAGTYWLLARSWVARASMPRAIRTVYRTLRVANVVLLAAGLAGILLWRPTGLAALVLVLAVWFFAVIEYVNYFVIRLSYPPARWFTLVRQWRTPRLVQDLNGRAPSTSTMPPPGNR